MVDRVCGVVVTYHPPEDLAQHMALLREQVGGLVVVDNKSSDGELAWLRKLAERHSFTLLENPDNLGIGTALNRGIRWAVAQGRFRYVALFDQDSEVHTGFVDALVFCLERHPSSARVAVAAPRIRIRNTGAVDGPRGSGKDNYLVAQTSGSLMPLRVFDAQGFFNEELFIDYVDYEYCLRAVTAGWIVLCCQDATLSHSPGNARRHSFHGLHLGTSMNYSPLRHYYSTRNGLWVIGQYWRRQPQWCAQQAFLMLKEKMKLLIFEKDRRAKLRLSMRGLRDAVRSSLGKRQFPEANVGRR